MNAGDCFYSDQTLLKIDSNINEDIDYEEIGHVPQCIDDNYFYLLSSKTDLSYFTKEHKLTFLPSRIFRNSFFADNDCLIYLIVESYDMNIHSINPMIDDDVLNTNYQLEEKGNTYVKAYWYVVVTAKKGKLDKINKVVINDKELISYNYATYSDNYFDYVSTDGNNSYSIIGYHGPNNMCIPSAYNSAAVTEISDSAFKDCNYITSVEIPSTIKKIGEYIEMKIMKK